MIRSFHPSVLRLLRVFHAVVEHGGFTAAEAVLNVGQPTISSHIRDLEDRLGFEVCVRGRAGFRLTDAGQRLYESTQRLERDLAGFITAVNGISDELQGIVRIGMSTYTPSASPHLSPFPAVLRRLKLHYPAVKVELHIQSPREVRQGVIDGRYDFAVSHGHLEARNEKVKQMFDVRMYLYCSSSHELFDLPDEEICDSRLAKFEAVLNVQDQQRQVPFQDAECVLAEASEVSIFYVFSGMYLGYLSEVMASRWVDSGHLRALRPSTYYYDSPAGLILSDRAASNPAVQKVLNILSEIVASSSDRMALQAEA